MKIKFKEITVRELTNGYQDNNEEGGVIGYDGKLDIRPPYQREFVYKDKQRDAVIDTLRKGFPLNVMYWAVRDDGKFEMIDGQQRTLSISKFVDSVFAIDGKYFHNLQKDEQEQILKYKLMIYQCTGTGSEKLGWFETINIAGEKLTNQELRNAVYSGSWVTEAKRHFSKTGCAAFGLGSKYLTGAPIRQDYLETAIKWISNDDIENYMGKHQHKPNALELWEYFQKVIHWVKATFTEYRDDMKGVEWGFLYNDFNGQAFDSKQLEEEVAELMNDDEVTNPKGIYTYILTRKEKHLNIRSFDKKQKQKQYKIQKGICVHCKDKFDIKKMEADHITPWHLGGKTDADNCQMLCKDCNRTKGGK
ncbi:MAG: DUF262 domain-containing protein [Proteobacteria bacterium]|nr:DUF262 domain-containing protein [Pseudomonadota bacterium]